MSGPADTSVFLVTQNGDRIAAYMPAATRLRRAVVAPAGTPVAVGDRISIETPTETFAADVQAVVPLTGGEVYLGIKRLDPAK